MAQIKKIVVGSTLVAVVLAGPAGVALGQQANQRYKLTIGQIETYCTSTIDQNGFGHANLPGGLVQKQTGQLSVPCKIRLQAGTTLTFNHVQLKTHNLLIENAKPDEAPVHLRIAYSSLSGESSGFQVKFTSNKSSLVISDSQFNYPLSIGAALGQKDSDSEALVQANRSTFTSVGEGSEGILMASTGRAIFGRNQFQLKNPEDTATLIGSRCLLVKNNHANDRCHGE
jgi:plastocyanin